MSQYTQIGIIFLLLSGIRSPAGQAGNSNQCAIGGRYCPSPCKLAREIRRLSHIMYERKIQDTDDLERCQATIELARREWNVPTNTKSYVKAIRDSITTVGRRNIDIQNIVKRLQYATRIQIQEIDQLQGELVQQQLSANVLDSEQQQTETHCQRYCRTSRASFSCSGYACTEVNEEESNVEETCMLQQVPTGIDCANLYSTGQRVSGLYSIRPVSGPGFNVYCDMETDGGGWTVVQRRTNGELDFDRNWDDYRTGFGTDAAKCDGEFWLGNEHLVRLTSNNFLTVRFEITDWQDQTRVAEYYYFRVNNDRKFTVQISQYQETKSNLTDSITGWGYPEAQRKNPNNMKFTTRDNDNDLNETGNCAHLFAGRHGSGGWWYNSCMAANINGHYYHGGAYNREGILDGDGIMWPTWAGISYSMKATEMKVRPHDFSQK